MSYKNKSRVFTNLNNYKQCPICLENNVLNIIFDCGHEICISCYAKNDSKCYFNFCL